MSSYKSVTDLGSAAYLLMHNYKVIGKRGKEIIFVIDEDKDSDQFEQLILDYLSSEFHRFDSCIMSLKKIGESNIQLRTSRFVTDLGAAAYILMHKYKVMGRRGKAIYFEIEENGQEKFDELSLEYLSGEFHRFDSCLMSLKKINDSYTSKQ